MVHRVLLVEDDPDIGHLLTVHLAELDCECRWVTDGIAALDQVWGPRYRFSEPQAADVSRPM